MSSSVAVPFMLSGAAVQFMSMAQEIEIVKLNKNELKNVNSTILDL